MAASAVVDYVVVGAGSAGCVLAARLSEDPGVNVLLLEAGGDSNPISDTPGLLLSIMQHGWFYWPYQTEPQLHLENRQFFCPRGRIIGGGSSINGMLYDRGDPADYNSWAQYGVGGWSYPELLPYFCRLETWHAGESPYHGNVGPVQVGRPGANHPLSKAWIEAGQHVGLPLNSDFSGASRYGVGPSDFTVTAGRRSSTSRAYLHAARRRSNLKILKRSVAQRIIVEKGRATGLEYTKGARMHKVSAREVIVSAGAINSPKLLMLSGIGDPNILSTLDIPIAMALPGVGKNLQDHLAVSVSYRCTQPITLFNHVRPTAMVKAGLQYLLRRSGPLSVPAYEVIAYMRSSDRESSPDLKFTLALALFGSFGRDINTDPGFSVYVEHLRPQSTGSIHLRSKDPSEPPLIHPNFLAAQADWAPIRSGVRLARKLVAQAAFDLFRGEELTPGCQVQSHSELDDFIRANAVGDIHSVGTCRMGTDRDAVVDQALRVHGVDGLRVVDASVIPRIISGNTNIPVIMVAEKASDMIRGLPALAATERTGVRQQETRM